MASPCDGLDDIPFDAFGGAMLQLDPMSVEPSRNVSPNLPEENQSSNRTNNAAHHSTRPNSIPGGFPCPVLKPAFSETLPILSSPCTPPTPEDVGRGFYTDEGLSRSFYQQPPIGRTRRYSWHCHTPLPPHPQLQFFSIRAGALAHAVEQCMSLSDAVVDGGMRGVWLLTQIHHWDLELERLVLLCDYSLLVFKYDFIALKPLHFTRLQLRVLSKALLGELVYPQRSLVPVISGLAEGVVSVLRSVLFPRLHSTLRSIAATATKASANVVSKTKPAENGDDDEQREWGDHPDGAGKHSDASLKEGNSARADDGGGGGGGGGVVNDINTNDDSAKRKNSSDVFEQENDKHQPQKPDVPKITDTVKKVLFDDEVTDKKVSGADTANKFTESQQESSTKGGCSTPKKPSAKKQQDKKYSSQGAVGGVAAALADVSFEPRSRNMPGLRLYNQAPSSSKTTSSITSTIKDYLPNIIITSTILKSSTEKKNIVSTDATVGNNRNANTGNSGNGKADGAAGNNNSSINNKDGNRNKFGATCDDGSVTWKQKWNPFCCSIPYYTLTSHPLYWYTAGDDASTYDVVDLAQNLSVALTDLALQPDTATVCRLRVARVFRQFFEDSSVSTGDGTKQGFANCDQGNQSGDDGQVFTGSAAHSAGNGTEGNDHGDYKRVDGKVTTGKAGMASVTINGSDSDSNDAKLSSNGGECRKRGKGVVVVDGEEGDEEDVKLVVENYVGLVSLLHNASHLGYFKLRGKISF